MGDGYMCGRNVKMKESLSHFCGISFLPKWDFFFAAYKCFYVHIIFTAFYMVYFQCFICVLFQAWHLSLFRQDEWRVELWNLKT